MKCAIVDLGSNTIRLSLYNTLENGGFETLFSKKYMAGLAGYVSHGCMSNVVSIRLVLYCLISRFFCSSSA